MKRQEVRRYDLDKVYFMDEYNKAVAYGTQNINVEGVREQLQKLENEKASYVKKVESVVNPERDKEHAKYQQYEKWAKTERKFKWIEIMLIVFLVAELNFHKFLPVGLRTSALYILLEWALFFLTVFLGPIVFIVSKLVKHSYGMVYNRYVESIANSLNALGNSFQRTSSSYYDAIDNLYLNSLDPTLREMILSRREQKEFNRAMLQEQRLARQEQRLTRQEQQQIRRNQEEMLAIERERERRYRGW